MNDAQEIVTAAVTKLSYNESLGLRFIADEIENAGDAVLIVGRVQAWREGGPSHELPVVLLWDFEADEPARIRQFASKRAALDAAHAQLGVG